MARQLRYKLKARVWTETAGTKVLADAVIVPAVFDQLFNSSRNKPVLAIKPGAATPDPETRGFIEQRFDLLLVVDLPGDDLGQHAMIGAGRSAGVAASKGRGLLEIEEEIKATIRALISEGFRLSTLTDGDADAAEDPEARYCAYRTYSVMARCTEDRYYHPPRNLVAAGGVGQVVLSWTLPPDRWDRRRVVLRRAAGATPPATVTSGTGVALSGDLATGVTDAVAAGTYSYALFATYDEKASSTDERVSAQETGTTRASVVAT